jgi:aminoglycoside/choline kinase family phosphotransferase
MKTDDARVSLAKKILGLSSETHIDLTPLAERGSDRSYYRLQWDRNRSAIFMHYSPERRENTLFAEIAAFLSGIGVPTARILGSDPGAYVVVMEDLGDADLWSLRNESWENRSFLYRKTLDAVERLHSYPVERFPLDRIPLAEAFNISLYRWERDYFLENFVGGLCGIRLEPGFRINLEAELDRLAERLSTLPGCLVHRDLQSQNIMVRKDGPVLIDFQGMRFGTLFYDLGSLLYDPYVEQTEAEREELLVYYYQLAENRMKPEDFQRAFLEASVQRLMQALGAYGFLGTVKGLSSYLAHVRPGLGNLQLVLGKAGTLPCLEEIVSRCARIQAEAGHAAGV